MDPGLIAHEGDILCLGFSPFNDFLLASGSLDSTLKLWALPVEGPITDDVKESLVTLSGHSNKVQLLNWNPLADNVLASGSARGETIIW